MSPRARQAKGKARLNAYEQLLNEDTAEKIDRVEIYIPPGPRLGDVVVEARDVRKGYGDVVLMENMTFTLPKGGIVGVIGPNGAGKTTLFRMLVGSEGAGRRHAQDRRDRPDRLRRSVTRVAQSRQDGVGGDFGRRGRARARQEDDQLARVRLVVQLPRARSAAEGRHALGRAAQPRPPREAAPARLQSAAPRRADQRPRRRHLAGARRSAPRLRRLRRGHLARPLVPRPHRDAHPRVRRGQPRGVVRGELPGLRGGQEAPARAPLPTSRIGSSTESSPGSPVGTRARVRGVSRVCLSRS